MYLPAFPAIAASMGSPQYTLAAWFIGLAIGQLTQGALADRFGRRVPLLFGTALYTAASAGCALSHSILAMSLCRLLAAFGGSASTVMPRAIVRDVAEGPEAARMIAQLMLIMGAAPILAPTLGGLMLEVANWRAIFWFAAAYGAIALVAVAVALPDTLPPALRAGLNPLATVRRYNAVLRERHFITHAMQLSLAMFALFCYLGGAPGVFIRGFGISPTAFGGVFGCNAAAYILGSQINATLLRRFSPHQVLRGASNAQVAAGLVLTADACTGFGGLLGIMLPLTVTTFCIGLINPNATVGALARHRAMAGIASALMGTLSFVLGAVGAEAAGALADGTPRPMALLMLFGASPPGSSTRGGRSRRGQRLCLWTPSRASVPPHDGRRPQTPFASETRRATLQPPRALPAC